MNNLIIDAADEKIFFKLNYNFEDVRIFLNRFEYLSIKFENDNFYIDNEFETIDYCVIMLTEKIVSRYQNKFLN